VRTEKVRFFIFRAYYITNKKLVTYEDSYNNRIRGYSWSICILQQALFPFIKGMYQI